MPSWFSPTQMSSIRDQENAGPIYIAWRKKVFSHIGTGIANFQHDYRYIYHFLYAMNKETVGKANVAIMTRSKDIMRSSIQ